METTPSRLHWSARPFPLLLAVMAAQFVINLVQALAVLPMNAAIQSSDSGYGLSVLIGFAITAGTLALYASFYWLIRHVQKMHHATEPVSWQTGIVFWVGAVFFVVFIAVNSHFFRLFLTFPATEVLNTFESLSSMLLYTLFLVLLFPVLERRFGITNGILILSAAHASLTLLYRGFSVVLALAQNAANLANIPNGSLMDGMAGSVAMGMLSAAVLTVLRSALYLAASRHVPGTWLLITALPGLLALLRHAVQKAAFPKGGYVWPATLLIDVPYYLLLIALSLGLLAAARRWKTFQLFSTDAKAFFHRLRSSQQAE